MSGAHREDRLAVRFGAFARVMAAAAPLVVVTLPVAVQAQSVSNPLNYSLDPTTKSQAQVKGQTLPPNTSGALDQNQGFSNPQANAVNPQANPANPQAGALPIQSLLNEQSQAQATTQYDTSHSAFARDRSVSVAERQHPEYQPFFIYAGSFILKPEFDTATEYSDNIFATQTGKISDGDVNFKPSLAVESNWGRDSLSGALTANYDQYFQHQSESQGQVDVNAKYRKDLLENSYVQVSGEYGDLVFPRSSTTFYFDAKNPVRYDHVVGDVMGVYEENRYKFIVEGNTEYYGYHDEDTTAGVDLQTQVNSHLTSTGSVKAEYAYNPGVAIYATALVNDHDYHAGLPGQASRNSNGFTIAGGADFDIGHLVRGDVQVGYLDQSYAVSSVKSVTGLSLLGKVEYFPTELTSLTFTAKRGIEDTSEPDTPSFLTTGGSAQIDHELYRNIILTAYGSYFSDKFQGVDRNDTRWAASGQVSYLMTRHITWTLAIRHDELTSTGAQKSLSFSENDVLLTLGLRY
jgi:hypothetical protein